MSKQGFLIGALLMIASETIKKRAFDGFVAAGFGDLRPSHTVVFQLLGPDGDRVSDLAERAFMTKQAMSYLVEYLETHGYLERVPDPSDGRAQLVRRTAKGWEVNRTARQLVEQIQEEWAEQLGGDKMEQLVLLLRELVSTIGIDYEGSVPQISTDSTPPNP